FSATAFRRFRQDGRVGRLIAPPGIINYRSLLGQNGLCCSSVMLDLAKTGAPEFNESGVEDFALWLELTRTGARGLGLQQDLVRYRITGSSRGSNHLRTAYESWKVLGLHAGGA